MTHRAWAGGLLTLLLIAGVVLLALHWQSNDTVMYYEAPVMPVASMKPYGLPAGAVDVNSADYKELETLEGINRSQIEALLEDRERSGIFDFPEDIIYVKGIGEKTLAKIFDQLDFSWHVNGN